LEAREAAGDSLSITRLGKLLALLPVRAGTTVRSMGLLARNPEIQPVRLFPLELVFDAAHRVLDLSCRSSVLPSVSSLASPSTLPATLSMDSITMASQHDWILMQFTPHQNSSVEPSTEEQLIVYLIISRFHDGCG
jgi:hypothetical protein